jgi:hypothetical protein
MASRKLSANSTPEKPDLNTGSFSFSFAIAIAIAIAVPCLLPSNTERETPAASMAMAKSFDAAAAIAAAIARLLLPACASSSLQVYMVHTTFTARCRICSWWNKEPSPACQAARNAIAMACVRSDQETLAQTNCI